ncbi:MAG: GNAT family N-acetyltransferase [Candidatus Helarchaeota archaeon]
MTIEIRRFKKEDEDQAKELMVQLCKFTNVPFDEKKWHWGVSMRLFDALRRNGMLVAVRDGKVVGMCFGDIAIDPTGQSTGYIRNVIVDANEQGQGIGKLLIKKAIEYLSEMEVSEILINVRSTTERALKLYKDLGFKPAYQVMKLKPQQNK